MRESTDRLSEQKLRSALVHRMSELRQVLRQERELRQVPELQQRELEQRLEQQLQQLAFLQESQE